MGLDPRQVFAGYMWRRARPDCQKGDIVLIQEHIPQSTTHKKLPDTDANGSKTSSLATFQHVGGIADLQTHHAAALEHVERNLRHELIHAFDDARGYIESADCTHQACSEIRAARLSGDCFAGEEIKKGRFDMLQGGLRCVKRRATTAVEMNPVCRGFSERAVETVFQRCYSDYEPFAAPVYAMGSYGERMFENATWRR